jgi:hypothetical protein
MLNGKPFPRWAATLIGVAFGAGSVVAATYNKFETINAHEKDIGRIEELLQRKDELDQQRYQNIMDYLLEHPLTKRKTVPPNVWPPRPEVEKEG